MSDGAVIEGLIGTFKKTIENETDQIRKELDDHCEFLKALTLKYLQDCCHSPLKYRQLKRDVIENNHDFRTYSNKYFQRVHTLFFKAAAKIVLEVRRSAPPLQPSICAVNGGNNKC